MNFSANTKKKIGFIIHKTNQEIDSATWQFRNLFLSYKNKHLTKAPDTDRNLNAAHAGVNSRPIFQRYNQTFREVAH